MENISAFSLKLLAVVVCFVIVIAGAYLWLLPVFFDGHKTYSIIVLGAIGSAIFGAYFSYQMAAANAWVISKFIVALLGGGAVGALVTLLSLFWILNKGGA